MPLEEKKASRRHRRASDEDQPTPVPPPPVALVSLLKSNKEVLKYFTSLQANLDADVQKWKTRAKSYKQECDDLRSKLGNTDATTTTTFDTKAPLAKQPTIKTKATPKSPPAKKKSKVEVPSKTPPTTDGLPQKAAITCEINDSIFEDMMNELTSDDDSVEETIQLRKTSNSFSLCLSSDDNDDDEKDAVSQSNQEESYPPNDMIIYLRKASSNLQQLGITLTETTDKESDFATESALNETESIIHENDDHPPLTKVLVRRCDHDVVSDLFFALRSVTKVQKELKEYQPFSLSDFIPCCNVESHPANAAKELVFEALVTMDVYCDAVADEEWALLFSEDDSELSIGMRNRKDLVRRLMDSLHGEITDNWPMADRATRLITTSLHFDPRKEAKQNLEAKCNEGFGSKSQGRISWLAERCLLAQLLVRLYLNRCESREASLLVLQYIRSSTPALGQKDYPRYPPALSICVFESMVFPGNDFFSPLFQTCPFFLNAVALAIRTTAAVWLQRLQSADDRITDVARIELASYRRLLKTGNSWLGNDELTTLSGCESRLDKQICQQEGIIVNDVNREAVVMTDQLLMALKGDLDFIYDRMNTCIQDMQKGFALEDQALLTKALTFERSIETHSWTCRQLLTRSLDRYRDVQGTIDCHSESLKATELLMMLLEAVMEYGSGSTYSEKVLWVLLRCTLQAFANLADGIRTHGLVLFAMSLPANKKEHVPFRTLLTIGQMPTVRVINLQRRSDRWNTCIAQALSERVLVVKAVVKMDCDHDLWGGHAFDGLGRSLEVDRVLSTMIGRPLNELVETKWRPTDLLAFDFEARKDEALVPMSPSERACALSHVCSWKGVERSLQMSMLPTEGVITPHVLRLYRISGFARGPALLHTNEAMLPTPVCVILEDDAILVDRFVDRLEALLDELPRDFHFCSIGYSRPKTAPMVEVSSQLGIPTCLWYLTGYILSLEGSDYLLRSLPVVGPVDSWIGLKMMSNWDNIYGEQVGVGVHAQQNTKTPPRKELGRICRFRAFAALVPLCNQKTHLQKVEGVSGRAWRQRDTDVSFSGR
jgi:GR25 family glycosyltransferase involved in LPS biosynthesis